MQGQQAGLNLMCACIEGQFSRLGDLQFEFFSLIKTVRPAQGPDSLWDTRLLALWLLTHGGRKVAPFANEVADLLVEWIPLVRFEGPDDDRKARWHMWDSQSAGGPSPLDGSGALHSPKTPVTPQHHSYSPPHSLRHVDKSPAERPPLSSDRHSDSSRLLDKDKDRVQRDKLLARSTTNSGLTVSHTDMAPHQRLVRYILAFLKHNAGQLSGAMVTKLVHAVANRCEVEEPDDAVLGSFGLAFLDVLVRYGTVPEGCLHTVVSTLCSAVNGYSKESWAVVKHLMHKPAGPLVTRYGTYFDAHRR